MCKTVEDGVAKCYRKSACRHLLKEGRSDLENIPVTFCVGGGEYSHRLKLFYDVRRTVIAYLQLPLQIGDGSLFIT
jgi:hypothetical protein